MRAWSDGSTVWAWCRAAAGGRLAARIGPLLQVSSKVTPFWFVADTITPFVMQRQVLLCRTGSDCPWLCTAGVSILMCWFQLFFLFAHSDGYWLLDVASSWYERWINECSCQAFFLYRNLLASLLCHWLVGRSGRRGLRNDFRSLRRKGPFAGAAGKGCLWNGAEAGAKQWECCWCRRKGPFVQRSRSWSQTVEVLLGEEGDALLCGCPHTPLHKTDRHFNKVVRKIFRET
jgi:hypothetical protein